MARTKSDVRETVVAKLVDVFYEHGFDGTSLSIISECTGLQRASLYHHFPGGKEEMAKAVIEYADRWGEEFIAKLVMDNSIPPKMRLEQLMQNLDELHWRPEQLSPSNAFVIGGARAQFSGHIQWHYHSCVWMMTELMVACGIPQEIAKRRAWEQRILWEGGLVCSRVLGDMSLFRGLMQRMPAYLLSPPDTPGFLPEAMVLPTFVRTEPSAP